jgi:hypothetical protein
MPKANGLRVKSDQVGSIPTCNRSKAAATRSLERLKALEGRKTRTGPEICVVGNQTRLTAARRPRGTASSSSTNTASEWLYNSIVS